MALERALKTRDIVLFNVAAIVGMRWIALAAANGPSSLFLWVLAAVAFFIPQGFAVMALASAIPEEGGLYVWTKKAFGERHGFMAGWLYWANNILYFPTLTLSTVVFALYVFGVRFAHLEQSRTYTAGAALVLLGIALVFNIVGMKSGRWVQNIGGIAQWIPSAALLLVGLVALTRFGSATPLPASLARSGLRGASHDPLLRQPLLRLRRTGARARDGGRGRRAAEDLPARDRHLGPHDRGVLPARHDLAPLVAAAVRDLDHLRRQPGRSRRPERASACPGSDRRRRSS